ncbi:MAG: hypothetical protein HYS22_06900 [Deltaproteobacteria bacterium]|nr:hypothetical protein [Deltaproteobacteria bacterium]
MPRSVHALAAALEVSPSQILEEDGVRRKDSRRLMRQLQQVLNQNPDLEPDNVRHTLLLLQEPPIDRLRRSLTRAQKFNFYR